MFRIFFFKIQFKTSADCEFVRWILKFRHLDFKVDKILLLLCINITEIDIRKSTTVKLDKETFDMCIVLYPSNYCDPLSVGYPQHDDVDDTIINQTTIGNSSNKVNCS